jgi:hypothetical protein
MVSAAAQETLATVLWMHEEAVLASSQSKADFLRCAPAASLNRYGNILFGSSSPLCNDCSIISLAEVASWLLLKVIIHEPLGLDLSNRSPHLENTWPARVDSAVLADLSVSIDTPRSTLCFDYGLCQLAVIIYDFLDLCHLCQLLVRVLQFLLLRSSDDLSLDSLFYGCNILDELDAQSCNRWALRREFNRWRCMPILCNFLWANNSKIGMEMVVLKADGALKAKYKSRDLDPSLRPWLPSK